jgi:type II pantothenate kinase
MSNSFSLETGVLGVDLGATLCKLVLATEGGLRTQTLPARDLEAIVTHIRQWEPQRIAATGGGSARLEAEMADVPVKSVPEFSAWARGAPILAEHEGAKLPDRYLLVSLGTGTSVLSIGTDGAERVGGSALGGGTLLGLGKLLLDIKSFSELAALAERGDRSGVDLLVGDIYSGPGSSPLPRDLNAAHFAKLDSTRPEDIAHALMGLIGENIGLICGELTRAHAATLIVYCGSTFAENSALEAILEQVSGYYGCQAHFLERGAFCGAVGAAALAGA